MYKNELELFKSLTKEFGKVYIKNLEKEVNIGEEQEDYYDSYYERRARGSLVKYKKNDITKVVNTNDFLSESGLKCGKTVERSEYNDSTYDTILNTTYTCFIIHL